MKKILIFVSVLMFLLVLGFNVSYNYIMTNFVTVQSLYVGVSTDSLMRESELVFVGEVVEVSETKWNQDNGRFWSDGMPYYTITLSVIDPIVGEFKDEIVLTVLENSPLDTAQATVESDGLGGIPREHPLEIGERAVIFAHPTEIAWRKPERMPATIFRGSPRGSTYLEGENGQFHSRDGLTYTLEELTAEITQRQAKEN